MKEYKIQIEVCKFLKYLQDKYQFRFFHIPNEGKRSFNNRMILIKMGLKPGCPDLLLEFPAGRIVYIELKSKSGRLSDTQKLWFENSAKLKTPHYILKGDFGDIKDDIYSIVRKHGKFIETQPKSEVVK
tara:strand:+ start:839 stop:1225 length:387 start_codon:yes stop_codon:yes gene_type:complete